LYYQTPVIFFSKTNHSLKTSQSPFQNKPISASSQNIGCRPLLGFPGGLALCLSACSFGWWLMAGAGLF
jgi:hypothetical protein